MKQYSGEVLSRSAMAYIEAHSAEKFSLDALAGALFINGCYLLRTFRKYTGTTPLAYHNQVRCKKARELLVSTNRSISEIGEETGFVSSSHFSHLFKKTEGCTPSEYRRLYRPDYPEGTSL